jgi:trimeric autotransporter adhesin
MTSRPISRRAPARRVRAWPLLSALLLALACTDAATEFTPVDRVELSASSATLEAGRTLLLTATPRSADGAPIAGQRLRWSSSNAAVASVSDNGVVLARTPGDARIAVSAGGRSATTDVRITERDVATLELTPVALALRIGRTAPLVARPLDVNGQFISGRTVQFTTSNAAIATVSAAGVVTGVATGNAVITATSGGRTAQAAVTVSLEPVATVVLSPARDTLRIGDTRTLTATLRDATNAVLTDRLVSWNTTDAAVATVTSTGVVTARAVGSTIISAVSEGRIGQTIVVVLPRAAEVITLTPDSATLAEGTELQLIARVTAPDGTVLTGRAITYTSDAATIADVDSVGRVRARTAGLARITARSEGKTAVTTIRVVPTSVAEVRITPAHDTLFTGTSRAFIAQLRAANGTVLTGRTVTWTSGASLIATVSPDGIVTALAPGTALLAATSDGITGFATVTVRARPVASVSIAPLTPTVPVNSTVQLSATVRDARGEVLTDRPVTWSASDATVAFVSSTGLVLGLRAGTTTITATVDGVRGSTTVTVP